MANDAPTTTTKASVVARTIFLAALAESANVAKSAKTAGLGPANVYALRRANPGFRKAWAQALAEGYARLEADLLAEALRPASGKLRDSTFKERVQKQRIAVFLLGAHRAAVRGGAVEPPKPDRKPETAAQARKRLDAKFDDMRRRIEAGVPAGL